MIEIEILFTFILATILVVVSPGPVVILVIVLATRYGSHATVPLIAGVMCGDLAALLASFAGLGALLATSTELFVAFKWVAAVYLIYLGIKQWRAPPVVADVPGSKTAVILFRKAFLTTAMNPKTIIFFTVFIPQFILPEKPFVPQFIILGGLFIFLAALNVVGYAIFAGNMRRVLQKGMMLGLNRLGGGALIGAGIWTITIQRNTE